MIKSIVYSNIKIDKIDVSKNPRSITKKSVAELAADINRNGVIVPIAVKKCDNSTFDFELCDGGRRLQACLDNGLKVISAIVYPSNTTSEEIATITHASNNFRRKLTAMEEALSTKKIYDACGQSYKDTAIILGKNERSIACRVNAVNKISKSWLVEFKKRDTKFNPTISHLEILVQFDKDTQERIYKEINHLGFNELYKFKNNIEQNKFILSQSIFDNEGCAGCKKRTSANKDLFGEITKKSVDLCLDKDCWNKMTVSYIQLAYETAKAGYANLKVGFAEYVGYTLRENATKQYGNCIEAENVMAAKKTEKGAFPMFIVTGKHVGKILWRKLIKGVSKKAANSIDNATGPKSLKVRQELLNKKRWSFVNNTVADILSNDWDVKKLKYEGKAYAVMYLVTCFGIKTWANNKFNDIDKFVGKKAVEETVSKLFEMMKEPFIYDIKWNGPLTQITSEYITATEVIADIFQIDLTPYHEEARLTYPKPKSWANLKADGTLNVNK